jgi:large subunit ribosomal protein L20
MKAGTNSYIGRKRKKRDFRRLWNIRINNAVRPLGLSYSQFIHKLYVKRVILDRKALSNLSITHP